MKTNSIYSKRYAALALVLMLAACADIAGPGPETGSGEAIPPGMGLARIRLAFEGPAQSVRTAVPNIGSLYFTLDFTAPGKTAVSKTLSSGLTLALALEPAAWNLEVRGYADSTKAVLKAAGSASFSVAGGMDESFNVYLAPYYSSGATGSLSYSITLPDSVSRAWFGLYPLDAPESVTGTITPTTWETDISSSAGGTASSAVPDLPVGSYRAVIDLYNSTDNRAATWTGAAHIHNGSTTSLTRTFAATDFVNCSPPPTVTPTANTLAAKLDAALASPSGSYTIALTGAETDLASFGSKTLSVTGSNDISITIRGNGKMVQLGNLSLTATTGSSLTLVIQDLTLKKYSGNNAPMVWVNARTTLLMKAGSLITGNSTTATTSTPVLGGGVYVAGSFVMSGGAVSGNNSNGASYSSVYGAGVYVGGGSFAMNGGAVSGNTCFSPNVPVSGGGVYVASGSFTMSGGAVSGNEASSTTYSTSGGGVYVASGSFTMSGGIVSGNEAGNNTQASSGGGVYVAGSFIMSGCAVSGNVSSTRNSGSASGGGVHIAGGSFTMSGGTVSGNASTSSSSVSYGGGVYVSVNGTFSVSDGNVSGNTTGYYGGGVYVAGSFTMGDGDVRGNISDYYGGGVYVAGNGTFSMSDGDVRDNTTGYFGGGVHIDSNGTFAMSGGAVSGNLLSSADGYGREVMSGGGTFNISGDARPERVFLSSNIYFITISGPLTGGPALIDLGITSSAPLTGWLNKPIIKLDPSYSTGNLTTLKTHFVLGNSKRTDSPYTETPITGYTISNTGLFVAE
jgi:hypothetical protein